MNATFANPLLADFDYGALMDTVNAQTNPALAGSDVASEGLYTYVDNRTRGGKKDLLTGNTVRYLTEDELRKEFNASDNDELQRAFGTFENYLGYMDERQGLINSGDINPEWWAEGQAGWDNMQATQTELFDKWATNEGKDWTYAGGLKGNNQDGDSYMWNGSSFIKTGKVDDHAGFGDYLKLAAVVAASAWLGPQIAAGLSGTLGATGASIASGALTSATGQLAMTGSIDPSTLAASALTAGIGSLAEAAAAGSSMVDNAVWDLADVIGTDYDTAMNIVTGVSKGVISGGDLDQIALNAVGAWGKDQLKGFLTDSYGQTFDVANWFDEGKTTINTEDLYSFTDKGVDFLTGGEYTPEEFAKALATGAFDYVKDDGSLAFMDPNIDLPNIGGGEGFDLPELNWDGMPDLNDINWDWTNNLSSPDFPDLPSVDLPSADVDLPSVNIDLPDLGSVDLPSAAIELPDLGSVDLPSLPANAGGQSKPYTPKTSQELFAYTTLTPYQKKAIEPYKDYVAQARGMFA